MQILTTCEYIDGPLYASTLSIILAIATLTTLVLTHTTLDWDCGKAKTKENKLQTEFKMLQQQSQAFHSPNATTINTTHPLQNNARQNIHQYHTQPFTRTVRY